MSTTPKQHNPDNLTPEQYGAAEGWRLLYKGEDKAKDAEFYDLGGWFVASQGCPVATETTYRTRTPDPYAPKTGGWIKMSERKPTEADLPVWLHACGSRVRAPAWVSYDIRDASPFDGISHWRHAAADVPAPPQRRLTQEDEDDAAFCAWTIKRDGRFDNRAIWHSAIAYERAEIAKILDQYKGVYLSPMKSAIHARLKGTQ